MDEIANDDSSGHEQAYLKQMANVEIGKCRSLRLEPTCLDPIWEAGVEP